MAANPDKNAVIKNFSRYASLYDKYAGVQKKAAGILAEMLPASNIEKILEIGCGTGNYTSILREKFPDSDIAAIDASGEMLEVARTKFRDKKTYFIEGGVENVDFGGSCDLVTSNAAFHWLSFPGAVIEKCASALSKDGALIFSSFGPATFFELKSTLKFAAKEDVSIPADLFPGKKSIEAMLRKCFRDVSITERCAKETYLSLPGLLKKIKYSGTAGQGMTPARVWSPDFLSSIEEEYLRRFGGIEATYQIFFCAARL